jgi:hypothetical protein
MKEDILEQIVDDYLQFNGSSRPSSAKNEIAASSDSTTMPTLSIR